MPRTIAYRLEQLEMEAVGIEERVNRSAPMYRGRRRAGYLALSTDRELRFANALQNVVDAIVEARRLLPRDKRESY
jgi:hypothetical protein